MLSGIYELVYIGWYFLFLQLKPIKQAMKKAMILLVLYISITSLSAQKRIEGVWEGRLDAGTSSLRIVFHFDRQNNGLYEGSMDSPDQGVNGIHCDSVLVTKDSVIVKINAAFARLNGLRVKDSNIEGNWEQRGMKFPISLKLVTSVSNKPNRPQTPMPPFTYNSEEVEYDNADKSVHFGATLTYPKGDGPFPAIIMITGSGLQDRDETIFEHKPFAVIADYLTKRGFAVLRIDDRGMGKSKGDVMNATSADFAKDVETSLAYLKNRKEVDKKRIGFIGHSEGGLIADMVASRNPDINFIITLAGPGVKGADILVQQNEAIFKADSLPNPAVDAYMELYKKIMNDAETNKDTALLYRTILNDFVQWKSRQSPEILTELNLSADSIANKKIAKAFAKAFALPWMKYFIGADPRPYIEKLKCKVLALDGSKDLQVNASINLAAINQALKKSKSPSYETKEIPGLNHLFQHCKKCTVAEYSQIEETFAPDALEIIGEWLDKNVNNKK